MQITYAALDAACLLGIFKALAEKHSFQDRGSQPAALHACHLNAQRLAHVSTAAPLEAALRSSQAETSEEQPVDESLPAAANRTMAREALSQQQGLDRQSAAKKLPEQLGGLSLAGDPRSIDGRGLQPGHLTIYAILQLTHLSICVR